MVLPLLRYWILCIGLFFLLDSLNELRGGIIRSNLILLSLTKESTSSKEVNLKVRVSMFVSLLKIGESNSELSSKILKILIY